MIWTHASTDNDRHSWRLEKMNKSKRRRKKKRKTSNQGTALTMQCDNDDNKKRIKKQKKKKTIKKPETLENVNQSMNLGINVEGNESASGRDGCGGRGPRVGIHLASFSE